MAMTITNRQVLIAGVVYDIAGLAVIEANGDSITIRRLNEDFSPHHEPSNICSACMRYDLEPVVYKSVEEAVDAAFLVRVEAGA